LYRRATGDLPIVPRVLAVLPQIRALHPTDARQGRVRLTRFLYVITYTTSPAEEAKRADTFDRSAHAFELTSQLPS
jgi:hypothetical protein